MKRPQITVRRLMLLVAVTAVLIALMRRRSESFRAEASRQLGMWRVADPFATGPRVSAKARYHSRMARKYDLAARRPWLPVGPDLPEPE